MEVKPAPFDERDFAARHFALDVALAFPGAPSNTGFEFAWDTTRWHNGPHEVSAIATDQRGNVQVRKASVVVAN
jgi:hypothetical protein